MTYEVKIHIKPVHMALYHRKMEPRWKLSSSIVLPILKQLSLSPSVASCPHTASTLVHNG